MKFVDPPFELGETLAGTDDDGNLINDHWLGQIFEFPSVDVSVSQIRGSKGRLTGRSIVAVILRNTSTVTLYGKHMGQLDGAAAAGYTMLETVDGYTDVLAGDRPVHIDEYIATDGVADDDLFWGILKGPVTSTTASTNTASLDDLTAGRWLVSCTASGSSQDTDPTNIDAGELAGMTFGASTADTNDLTLAFHMNRNIVGYALSATTTNDTDADILINACIQY